MPPDETHDSNSDSTTLSRNKKRKRGSWRLMTMAAIVVAVGGAIVARFADRVDAEERLARTTLEAAVPSVTVIHPEAGAPNQVVVLPGYTQAFTDAPVYARTSGYLKTWRFDIGAHVRKGDLLAEIDTPEVDQQLRQARADLATAQANLQLAAITAKRNEDLLKTRSVSTQERDNADGALAADTAIVQSNEGNVARLVDMLVQVAFEVLGTPATLHSRTDGTSGYSASYREGLTRKVLFYPTEFHAGRIIDQPTQSLTPTSP